MSSSIVESIPEKSPSKKREGKKPKRQEPKAALKTPDGFVELGTETLPPLADSAPDDDDVRRVAANELEPVTEPDNPNRLGLFRELQAFQIPKYEKTEDNAEHYAFHARGYYTSIYGKLCKFDNILNITQGLLARLKGTVYNHLYHVLPELRAESVMTQEQFREWRNKHCPDVSDSTMENHRHIAHRFPLDYGCDPGVVDMLNVIKNEKMAALTHADKKKMEEERKAKAEEKERKKQAAAEARLLREAKAAEKTGNPAAPTNPGEPVCTVAGIKQAGLLGETLATHTDVVDEIDVRRDSANDPQSATSSHRTPIAVVEVKRGQVATALLEATVALKPIAGWFLAAIKDNGSKIYENPQATLAQLEGFELSLKLIEGQIGDIRAAFKSVTDAVKGDA